VVPFTGSEPELARVRQALSRLRRGPADELIVVDNRREPAPPVHRPGAPAPARDAATPERDAATPERDAATPERDTATPERDTPTPGEEAAMPTGDAVRVLRAAGVRTPAFARNAGARAAAGEWLVFIDADTDPDPELLDAYFEPLPAETVGLLAGGVLDAPVAGTTASRYAVARRQMDQAVTMERPGSPYAQTSNCAVRRRAFEQVGGFVAEARAGEDADLCFRLARAGWTLERRPSARVVHRARRTVRALVAQLARHGSGAAWLERRYPGEFPAPGAGALARRAAAHARAASRALGRGEREAAAFALIDLAGMVAFEGGRRLPNLRRH
jgi:GT2 family glycosyltransferase